MKNQLFKNDPSRKFFDYFQALIESGDISVKDLAEKMGKYQHNPSALLGGLKRGVYSVTVEMILIAEEKFGLNPCYLFGKDGTSINTIDTDESLEKRIEAIEEAIGLNKKHRRSG